jgi:hypothetical protein
VLDGYCYTIIVIFTTQRDGKYQDTLHEDQYTFFITSRSVLLIMRNVSDKSCRKYQITHFMFNNFLFRKPWRLWDNVEKLFWGGQTTDNRRHAHCMLYAYSYKHTLTICNTDWISTSTMVAQTRINVTLYLHRLSCLSPAQFTRHRARYTASLPSVAKRMRVAIPIGPNSVLTSNYASVRVPVLSPKSSILMLFYFWLKTMDKVLYSK